jgi:hypothetical protein
VQSGSDNPEHRDDPIERRLRELSAEISGAAHRAAQAAAKEKAHEEKQQQRRSGRGLLRTVGIVVAVIIIAGGVITWRLSGSSSGGLNDTNAVHNGAVPSGSATVVAPPVVPAGPPADAFAGTPADHWADGAAGIVVPAAKPTGQFTAAQAAAATQITRKLLIAGNLDWTTLNGGAPTAFADLLTRQQRTAFVDNLDKVGLHDGFATSSRILVMSFAPGTVSFVTKVVKVHGSMSAGTAVVSGTTVLRVAVNYLFIYAIEPPGHPADWMRVVAQDYGYVEFAQWDDPGGPLEPWVVTGISPAGGQCGMTDGYVHPAYPTGVRSSVQPSGPAVNPYLAAPPPTSSTETCRQATGT